MARQLSDLLNQNRPIYYDGATGTLLRHFGLRANVAPETWVIENPAMVLTAAEAYVNAGAQIILTCTFGGTAFRLQDSGLAERAAEINRRAVELAKVAAGARAFVAGSMGPLGYLALKLGALSYPDAVAQFAAQAQTLADAGVDVLHLESVSDLQEAQAAIEGARRVTDLPLFVTLSFDTAGKTLLGATPRQAAQALARFNLAALGANCGGGPWETASILRELHAAAANTLLIAKPNAGMPDRRVEPPTYPVDAAHFGILAREWVRAGAKIIGGCCGTTPAYITAIQTSVSGKKATGGSVTIM